MRPAKAFGSLIISAPWLSVGGEVSLYEGGTITGNPLGGIADGDSYEGGTLVETVSVSSTVTNVTL